MPGSVESLEGMFTSIGEVNSGAGGELGDGS
jgi:hypothetical protein